MVSLVNWILERPMPPMEGIPNEEQNNYDYPT